MSILALTNARVFCPASGRDGLGSVTVAGGVVAALDAAAPADAEAVDCGGHLLIPGLIDMGVSTGEPGEEHRETLRSAGRAAVAGGVTTAVLLPDTHPVLDEVALVEFAVARALGTLIRMQPMAALTKGLAGVEMTEIGLLRRAGAVAFSNGRHSVADSGLMRNLLSYARDFDALVVHHTEDEALVGDGVMHEGEVAARLGLPGIPAAAETILLARDLALVALTGARYHAASLSTAGSVGAIRAACAAGLPVTAGASINNLVLNENDVVPYRTYFKVRPPLRSEADRQALVAAVADGTISVIHSDHNPQDADMKRRPFAEAAFGAIGLETMLPAALRLYHSGEVPLARLIDALSAAPARLLGLDGGRIAVGAPADFTLVDLERPWRLAAKAIVSRSRNTPFDDALLQGAVLRTWVAGKLVYSR